MQDTHLFTGTIADNIRYGKPDGSDEEVLAAAKADEKIGPALEIMQVVKELYVPGKLVNIVVKPAG